MHDCALGREGGSSAPRVEHRYYYARNGINGWQEKKMNLNASSNIVKKIP